MTTPDGLRVCRALLLLSSVDLPAKAAMLNVKQYNGKHGCSYCDDEGVSRPGCPMARDWPFTGSAVIRTHETQVENAIKAQATGKVVS